jgi:hypothetical protein
VCDDHQHSNAGRSTGAQFISNIFYTKHFATVYSLLSGAFSISVLSGKLMFRDVLYVTKDLTFRYNIHINNAL